MPMMPPTIHGMPAMLVLSCLQKAIRRGDERLAMQCACELMHTSKAFCTMVCNRLKVIMHEDIDVVAQPWIPGFVHSACEFACARYKDPSTGEQDCGDARMAIGNAIRLLARAEKSREGNHFNAAFGLASLVEAVKPEIPDYAYDQHSRQGKKMGRGLDHFFAEGAKLCPPQKKKDAYEDEAKRLWYYCEANPGAVGQAAARRLAGYKAKAAARTEKGKKPKAPRDPRQGILNTILT